MDDPILVGRIEALQAALAHASRSVRFVESYDDELARFLQQVEAFGKPLRTVMEASRKKPGLPEGVPDPAHLVEGFKKRRNNIRYGIWSEATRRIDERTAKCREDLKTLRQNVERPDADLEEAWMDLANIQEQARVVFTNCLELIGGLAFREPRKDEDDAFWQVADAFAKEAAEGALPHHDAYCAVPSLDDAFAENLAMTLRLRFPEWRIWNLPLLVHEFAHVAIDQDEDRHKVLKSLVHDLAARELREMQPGPPDERRRWVERELEHKYLGPAATLLADAYASFTSGPAYACAAVRLRLDPGHPYIGLPSHHERARVILRSGKKLAVNGSIEHELEALAGEWNASVERAGTANPAAAVPFWPDLVDRACDLLFDAIPEEARYDGEADWLRAGEWAMKWCEQLDLSPHDELQVAGLDRVHKLRDLLNAAWLLRIRHAHVMTSAATVEKVQRDVIKLCKKLLALHREGAAVSAHTYFGDDQGGDW